MAGDRKRLPPPTTGVHLPVAAPAATPTVALPALPTSSGKVWGTRTTIMQADARFVRAHSDYLQARTEQTQQMKALVDARIGLALKIAELATLPELVEHEYQRGRRDRAHDTAMQRLTHEMAEVNARINLVRAQEHLASLSPDPAPSPPSSQSTTPKGLTPAEVELALQRLPELKRETIETLLMMLSGMVAEKNR